MLLCFHYGCVSSRLRLGFRLQMRSRSHRMGISCSSAEAAGRPHDIFNTRTPSSIAASMSSGWQRRGTGVGIRQDGSDITARRRDQRTLVSAGTGKERVKRPYLRSRSTGIVAGSESGNGGRDWPLTVTCRTWLKSDVASVILRSCFCMPGSSSSAVRMRVPGS